ncbi:MAG: Ig-like domain-containing protein [Patescibacteria group bacterium]|jgi:hypothetical protein
MFLKQKSAIILAGLFLIILGVLVIPQLSLAQTSLGFEPVGSTGLGTRDLKDIIILIIKIFLGFLGIIAVGLIIWGGYTWMTSGGEEDKISEGKKIITNAVIGLIIILSSYAIVLFVVSRFSPATLNSGNINVNEDNGNGGNGDGGNNAIFRVTNLRPRGNLRIRNVVVQASFNKVINPVLIGENNVLTNQQAIKLERANANGGFERVEGSLTIDPNNHQRVLFTPNSTCPEPNQNLFCLNYDENNPDLNRYKITVENDPAISLRSVGGLAVSCVANSCSAEFTVGGIVDTQNPEVNFTEAINRANNHLALNNNVILSLDEAYQLLARATDDGGLSGVDFYIVNEFLSFSEPAEEEILDFVAQAQWATNGLESGTLQLGARAYDLAGQQSGLEQVTVRLRPAYCFNNQLDEQQGETAVDCGGSCGACDGGSCGAIVENQCTQPDNSSCASNVCNVESCLCQGGPRIIAVNPGNGAIGNWITITGRNFGDQVGRIYLGETEAHLPPRNFCPTTWSNEQIIIELPVGISVGNGQIRVVTSDGLMSNQTDFLVNNVERPGLCALSQQSGRFGDRLNLVGYQFGNLADQNISKDVYFGQVEQNFSLSNQSWRTVIGRGIISGNLPNLSAGQTSVKIRVNGQDSNALPFTILGEQNVPRITDFEPKFGNAGEYINIYGSGFGEYREGQSLVTFAQNVSGSFDFPDECRAGNSFWQDGHIIVKVPEGASDGIFKVITFDQQQVEAPASFDFQAEAELTPGICSLYPREGLVGSVFDVAGEYFNNGILKLGELDLNVEPDNAQRHFNNVRVPVGAQSGQVKVVRGDLVSNALDFIVTPAVGQEPQEPNGYYQWQFTTCDNCLVPEVVESQSCQLGLASPTPRKNSQGNFVDTLISAAFNTDMNNDSFDLGATVVISYCGNGQEPANCSQLDNLNGNFNFAETNTGENFTLALTNPLNTSSWYRVVLQNLTSQAENLPLAESYIWNFKTKDDNSSCQITNVGVNPRQRLISNNSPVYVNDNIKYQANAYNLENCNICPDRFTWSWDSSNQDKAQIDKASHINQSMLQAKAVTEISAVITATAQDNQEHSATGQASLDIVPKDFSILSDASCLNKPQSPSPAPSFTKTCLNAKISVQFDSLMPDSLLGGAPLTLTQTAANVTVPLVLESGLYYEVGGRHGLRGLVASPEQNLLPNTWYEVAVNPNLKNLAGGWLVGKTSWQFKTKASNELCQFDKILVNPASAVLQINANQNYTAQTLDGASCQLLKNPEDLRFSWRVENEAIASIAPGNQNQAVVNAKEIGETYIRATAAGKENSGENGRLRVNNNEVEGPVDLTITRHQPIGELVCPNALVQVRFNLELNSATLTEANFTVLATSQACPNGCPVRTQITANQNKTVVNLLPALNANWDQGTVYTVKVHGGEAGIKAKTGESLNNTGCSQGMAWEDGQSCNWSFTTKNDICQPKQVVVEPATATINAGSTQDWLGSVLAQDGTLLMDKIDSWVSGDDRFADVTQSVDDKSLAVSTGKAEGQAIITASIGQIKGLAILTVNDLLNGPHILSNIPIDGATQVCRNALVKVEFDKLLDVKTVNANTFKIEYQSPQQFNGCSQVAVNKKLPTLWPTQGFIGRLFNNLVADAFNWLKDKLFSRVSAAVYWCPVSGQWLSENYQGQTAVHFSLSKEMEKNTLVRVTVRGGVAGVKATNGLPLSGELNEQGNYSYQFTAGEDVCNLAFVTVSANQVSGASDWTFITSFDNQTDNNLNDGATFDTISDRDKKYQAAGFSSAGELLVPIAGLAGHDWSWEWQTSDNSVASLLATQDDFLVVGANNKNGEANITAIAKYPENYPKKSLSAVGRAVVDLCVNPWNPAGQQGTDVKFTDQTYNFSIKYCRDNGAVGLEDDLPTLGLPQAIEHNANDPAKDDLKREYLIPVPTTGDVVGLRIYTNDSHLSPLAWYQKNITVKGRPNAGTVDGYQSITDGRTVYVAAANAHIGQNLLGFNSQINRSLANLPVKTYKADNFWSHAAGLVASLFTPAKAAVAPGNNNGNALNALNFAQNLKQLENLNNQLYQGSLTAQEQADFRQNLNDFNQNYNRQELLNAGVDQNQLNAFEANLNNLNQGFNQQNNNQNNFDDNYLNDQINNIDWAFTNIYLLSYNQNANPATLEIVKRLLDNWNFNTNINNPVLKDKLIRDTIRLADLTAVAGSLDSYQSSHGAKYPTLSAGTFLSGRTNSKWPSWNQGLASELKSGGLPVDPINKFNQCIVCTEPQLLNSGFEENENFNDQSAWRKVGEERVGDQIAVTQNQNQSYIKEGNSSLSILAPSARGGVAQSVNLLPNTTYELSAWVYLVSGRAHLTFNGADYGNEWLSPPDKTGWVMLKNRLVTNAFAGNGQNGTDNFIFIRSHEGGAQFYVDQVNIQTQGGNCGYDRETCWNPNANQSQGAFACDAESYFYSYQSLGQSNYLLAAKMETTADWRGGQLNNHFRLDIEKVLGCTTQAVGGYCGDAQINDQEQCEPGMSYNYCPGGHNWNSPLVLGCYEMGTPKQCTWVNPDDDVNFSCYGLSPEECCGGYCGDGILNTQEAGYANLALDEECDISARGNEGFAKGARVGSADDNQYACSQNCKDVGGWCGDGRVQSVYGENCDGSAAGWACTGGGVPSCSAQSCQISCNRGDPYQGQCNDGIKQPQEFCDGQIGVGANEICNNTCSDSICVDGYRKCGDTCVAIDVNNCASCGNQCADPASGNGRAQCREFDHEYPSCGVVCYNGFHLDGGRCLPDAVCGNDIIEENEACDDGNHNGSNNYCKRDCSGFDLGNRIFLDNFDDGGVWAVPGGQTWVAREHGAFEEAIWSVVDLANDSNPYTLQGTNQTDGDPACGNSERWYLKSLVPASFNNQNVTIVSRIKIKPGNPNTLILGNYTYNQNNPGQESAYALWANYRGTHRLSLIKVNRMDRPLNDEGLVTLLDNFGAGQAIPTDEWYWLALKITHNGNNATINYIDWQDGQAMPDVADWHEAGDNNNNALTGGTFGLAVWGDCSTSWYDDFQVYQNQ